MKLVRAASILSALFAITLCFSCGNNNSGKTTEPVSASLIEVSIGGMTCTGCEQTIQTNVLKLDGIKSVKASFTAGNAIIEYIPAVTDTTKIKEAIIGSGYKVKKFSSPE